ncbi:MAG: glycosyltransferase family 2 protein [Microthrixaceae bacterium]
MRPRFSVVIPVRDRADVIGRAVTGVLAQTFADVEVLVVDDGSTDDTVAAARAVADGRVRVLRQDPGGPAAACANGLREARGRWTTVIDPDTEVSALWLARLGRLADATGARFVTCGGEQHHLDGSLTPIEPRSTSTDPLARACLRPGAFATSTDLLVVALDRDGEPLHAEANPATVLAAEVLRGLLETGASVDAMADGTDPADPTPDPTARADRVLAHTPERLVRWNDRVEDPPAEGDELRLAWAYSALDVLARTPIPDGELLARYATIGGVAAARLRRRADARLLFRIACYAVPEARKQWARLAVSFVPALSDRIWDPTADDGDGDEGAAEPVPSTADDVLDEPAVDLTADDGDGTPEPLPDAAEGPTVDLAADDEPAPA